MAYHCRQLLSWWFTHPIVSTRNCHTKQPCIRLQQDIETKVQAAVTEQVAAALQEKRQERHDSASRNSSGGGSSNSTAAEEAEEPEPPIPLTAKTPASCAVEEHADYDGTNLQDGASHKQPTLEACCAACGVEPRCNVFVYCPLGKGCGGASSQGSCWLKHQEDMDPMAVRGPRGIGQCLGIQAECAVVPSCCINGACILQYTWWCVACELLLRMLRTSSNALAFVA